MGLIGLAIAVLVMVLGTGYLFLGTSSAPLTVTNDAEAPSAGGIAEYEALKTQATDAKTQVEERAADVMQALDEPAAALPPDQPAPETTQATEKNATELHIVNRLMSGGFSAPQKARGIDTIVLHSSYDLAGKDPYSVSGIVKEYADYGVSAHYLIDRAGTIYRLVEDKNIAYHAGVSTMPDGRRNANEFSLGIEMMNTKTGQFTKAQYAAVNTLVASLKKKYPIRSVVGHSDIAPGRKTDPWNFDWKELN
ncbi:MAG: hypothetical protein A3E38_01805 [Candidatus Moranbacteria bacterium RIFCSPHIGHO2_12_FULL_54_9]|nr:MAG: hypothetical protein A2878_02540 [Candidatus Moranbacteria bacterium RIFCSPHIGHO2_01_FULL_54_31]OGI26416.1 MAG: hypothetical protein A3E38_01805 [Candidatus Moranbacteria bacterium RIFCSPHIGHO2_12_FULL_54_9]